MTKYFRRIWISLVSEATIGAPGGLRQAGPEGPWGGMPIWVGASGRREGRPPRCGGAAAVGDTLARDFDSVRIRAGTLLPDHSGDRYRGLGFDRRHAERVEAGE